MRSLLLAFCRLINFLHARSLYAKTPEADGAVASDGHLQFEHVRRLCAARDSVCGGGGARVCTVRHSGGGEQYADFGNWCHLFMSNMCDNPGSEFSIVSGGTCEQHLDLRRSGNNTLNNVTYIYTAPPALRRKTEMSTLYSVDTAFDFHNCPLSCPDTYAPVCVSVNRGSGMYFKFLTFVNHCSGDLYYCKHWQEFSPPPNEDENVVSSNLGWSFCGSSRYLQFARFAEVTSSMGHYGWLAGNHKYSHIMEPHERMEGYG